MYDFMLFMGIFFLAVAVLVAGVGLTISETGAELLVTFVIVAMLVLIGVSGLVTFNDKENVTADLTNQGYTIVSYSDTKVTIDINNTLYDCKYFKGVYGSKNTKAYVIREKDCVEKGEVPIGDNPKDFKEGK